MKKTKKKQIKTAPQAPAPHYFASAGPTLFLIAIIACVATFIYSNTFRIPFQFDDQISILGNPAIKDLGNLKAIFLFSPTRFFTYLTFAGNYHFNELNVFGYHLVNLIIHICASLLVMWFVTLTFTTPAVKDTRPAAHKKSIAFLAALLFAAHPVQTQAVTYVVQRLASLATLFYLLTMCLYIQGRLLQQAGTARKLSISLFCAAAVSAIIGMFTKETVFTLPFAILLYEFCFFRSTFMYNWKFLVVVFTFCLLIPLIIFSTSSIDFDKLRAMQEGPEGIVYISPLEYFFTQFRVLITYLRLVILPVNQNLDYDYPVVRTFLSVQTFLCFLALLGFFAVGIWAFAKHRIISFTIFWFFLTLSIESSFIPIRDVIFEHRLYLPMAGLSLLFVILLYNLFGKNNVRQFYTFMVIIIACCAALTFVRNTAWRDEVTLWSDAIEKAPNKVRPYNNRGRAYGNRSEYDKAMNDFRRAIDINPRCAEAYYNLGLVFALKGDNDKAIEHYDQALKLYPNYTAAYNNRGLVLVNKKEFDRAIKDYDQALRISPHSSDVYYNRGLAYYYKQVYDKAIADYSQALLINPRYGNAYHNRAIAYYMIKDYQKGLADIERMRQLGFKVDEKLAKALRDKVKEE